MYYVQEVKFYSDLFLSSVTWLLLCSYQLLYTTSSRLYHRLVGWRNKKFAYSESLFIPLKPHVFLKLLAFQSWLSHYIQVDAFLAGKIKSFIWILAVFFIHDLYLSFSNHFSFEWHLPGMVTSKRTTKQYKTDAVTPGKHVQTTDMLCALVTQVACTRSTREHWDTLFIWAFLFNNFHYVRN